MRLQWQNARTDPDHAPTPTTQLEILEPLAEVEAGVALDIDRPIDQLVALAAGEVTAARPKED